MITIDSVARILADEHRKEDNEVQQIFWVPSKDTVYLIEVTKSVADHGEVLPFRFAADPPEIPYESVVILLGPKDWEEIEVGRLSLPPAFSGTRVGI